MTSMTLGKVTINRAMGMRAAVLVMMLAMVAGCSSGDTAAPAPATSAPSAISISSVIGPAGGTVTHPDGVQVVIRPGALSADTTIGITSNPSGAPAPLQEGNAPASPIYEFTPHDIVFNTPVTIRWPVPVGAVSSEVFIASLGADWVVNNATPNGTFAEVQRNSFSFGMAGLGCAPPVGDQYPCSYPSGGATVAAAPSTAITQIAPGWLNFGSGSAGSWRVNPPGGTVSVTLHYRAAPDCSAVGGGGLSGNVRLIRWNPAVPLGTAGRVTTVFDQTVTLTQQPVTPPIGTMSHGGGPTFRGEGSTTVDISSHLGDATNAFGFTFSCQRQGHPVHTGGDLITIIGPMAAPGTTYSIGGTVTNLTGTGLVLRNNNGNDLAVPANATSFIFTAPIAAGALYNVTVQNPPTGQTCTVQSGSGTANAPVIDVAVTCAAISGGPLALVANSGSNTLSIYRVDASTGVLSSLGTVPAGSYPYRVAITPNGLYAYVTNLLGGTVSSFSINNITGVLTPIPLSSPGTQNPYGIAMDPSGRFVWVANYGFHTVSAFSINGSTGVLASAGPTVTAAGFPHSITAHPSGNFVYVGSEQANSISVYGVNPVSGQLTLSSTAAYSVSAPYSIAIHPLLNVAYVTDSNGYVIVFNINPSNGALTFSSNIAVGTSPTSVVVHPNGQYAYVANSGIRVYSINQSTGALTLSGSPVSAGSSPRTIAIDTTGTHLYVTNLGSNNVSAFSIGSGGAVLTSLGAAVATGTGPEGIALTP